MTQTLGTLYLIPSQLGDTEIERSASPAVVSAIGKLEVFFAENIRTARRFIGKFSTLKPLQEIFFAEVSKDTTAESCRALVTKYLMAGRDVGLLSESGCPGIADPGAVLVYESHKKNVPVKPLSGGSSITMALMSSGLQGQQFTFLGYLPIDKNEREKTYKKYVEEAQREKRSMVCIETPYRNDELLRSLVANLPGNFWLSIACELTEPSEFVKAMKIDDWKKISSLPSLHKRPCVFSFGIV